MVNADQVNNQLRVDGLLEAGSIAGKQLHRNRFVTTALRPVRLAPGHERVPGRRGRWL